METYTAFNINGVRRKGTHNVYNKLMNEKVGFYVWKIMKAVQSMGKSLFLLCYFAFIVFMEHACMAGEEMLKKKDEKDKERRDMEEAEEMMEVKVKKKRRKRKI